MISKHICLIFPLNHLALGKKNRSTFHTPGNWILEIGSTLYNVTQGENISEV